MSKTKRNELVTKAAAEAAGVPTMWHAVEANARRIAEEAARAEAPDSFAEIEFSGAVVRGVVKAGNVVLKIGN
jgi:hypothetical protein